MDPISILGYSASLLVLVSFVMKDIRHLRILNSVGCGTFILYGSLLHPIAWPIVITNSAIIGINIFYLTRKN
ncbi:MAG: uroporphyrinogen decarboxylase [Bacteroidetes bacterium]|nr:MAG: uroporphyrinogen decarboxylase [Bacteroidota bacterium]TNE98002.1 MAG: uroporphyrinogen decarboxylase [Bacteroidota bacterium]